MRHPSDGTLRRLVDEPAGVTDADRGHVAGCAACRSRLADIRDDAAAVAAALPAEVGTDTEAAWVRLLDTVDARPRVRPHAGPGTAAPGPTVRGRRGVDPGRATRWRRLRNPVVAGVAVVAVLSGATAAAAAHWLPIFRTEQVAPVTVTQADLLQLPDLSAYGEVTLNTPANVRRVPDATAAHEATGLSVPRVGPLPAGVTGDPTYQIGDQISATFTFSAATAARTARAIGKPLPPPPPGLDGSQFRMTAGPGVALVWTRPNGIPTLIVGRAIAPTAYSSGIPFTTARDYLLSLPGLPPSVASQLRTFTSNGTTLPLIVKQGQETASTADINGVPGMVLATKDRTWAAVFWVDDGVMSAVAGPLSADEVLVVARGLRWDR
jgi:hypothetical protein